MKSTTLAMTSQIHEQAFRYLFPGDGLEAAGVFLCHQGLGRFSQKLLVAEFLHYPHSSSTRSETNVTWPFASQFDTERIEKLDSSGQSIVTVHSHPSGDSKFSEIDDRNDRELFGSVNEWFADGRESGSAIMLPDGSLIGRIVDKDGDFQDFRSVNIVGENIHLWFKGKYQISTEYEQKVAQTLGKGTLSALQSMRVGVVGCSGTGSIVTELLARNCVGELVIVDNDIIEEKNLNRILNSTVADALQSNAKIDAISSAISKFGLETKVSKYNALTDSRQVVAALIDCDVIFGCVDSAFGRYHLDCIASAYLIPYFDVGVHVDADGSGNITSADAVSHYIHPEGRDLMSRGGYSMDQVSSEDWQRIDPDHYQRQQQVGYLTAVGEDQPAVMSINMQAACMAFNDFLSRIHDFRYDRSREFATQRFRFVHGCYETEIDDGHPNVLFEKYRATGDCSLLVRNNTRCD